MYMFLSLNMHLFYVPHFAEEGYIVLQMFKLATSKKGYLNSVKVSRDEGICQIPVHKIKVISFSHIEDHDQLMKVRDFLFAA